MNQKLKSKTIYLLGLLFTPMFFLFAEETKTLVVGDTLPNISYTNQFEEISPLPENTTKVLFMADMDASKIIHPLLEKEGKGFLEKYNAVLISDIHRMPSLITKFVALPKMKSYPYNIRLVREEGLSNPFPRTKGSVTLILLQSGRVKKISESNMEAEIREFLIK
ncbi:hypothetical protein P3G55_13005 [Leptospira sp. 96542]|nr:hypothetical protein [Leptospira sp. 96542]